MIFYDDHVISYNKQAMIALKHEQTNVAYNLLIQAQKVLSRKQISKVSKLWALTYNNLGCFYKRTNEYQSAIKYFEKSISEGCKRKENSLNLAGTHLNLCTIFSLTSDHNKALSHGILALEILKKIHKKSENYDYMTVVAYQNIAMEYENMSKYKESLKFYKSALNFSLASLGENNSLTKKIKERLGILENKISMWSLNNDLKSSLQISKKTSASFTPTLKKIKKAPYKNNYSPPRNNLKNKNGLGINNTDIVENNYNNLTKIFRKKKKIHETDVNQETVKVNTDRPKSVLEKRMLMSFMGNKKKKNIASEEIVHKSNKHNKSQSKSPEIFPVPFKDKLSLFDNIKNTTP